jgi:hypothetical protein
MRPLELLVMSGIVAVFVGLVVFASTRDIGLGSIFGGIAFIVAVLVLAMLALSAKPDDAELGDLDEQNHTEPERPSGH